MATMLPTDDEFTAALAALAESEGTTGTAVIRAAVLERHDRMRLMQRFDASAEARSEQMKAVLDRLGKA